MLVVPRRSTHLTLVGDLHTMEVHDMSNEKPRCRLDITFEDGPAVGFEPDSTKRAHDDGFNDCPYCIGSEPEEPLV